MSESPNPIIPQPIKLGTMLFTMVEPRKGHEVAYNRWYERDHFYAGCMIGPWQFAGQRWVATKDLKQRRFPADSTAVTPDQLMTPMGPDLDAHVEREDLGIFPVSVVTLGATGVAAVLMVQVAH